VKVTHRLYDVRQEPKNGDWTGACTCGTWVAWRATKDQVRKNWEAHAREKGAR
jgi:hypothetical protein